MGSLNISETTTAKKLSLKTPLGPRYGKVPALGTKIFPLGSAGPPFNVNLGPPNISAITTARKLKLKIQLDVVKHSLWVQKKSARGRPWGAGPPNVNLGPHNISETTRASLKILLNMVKYPFHIFYIIRHNMRVDWPPY